MAIYEILLFKYPNKEMISKSGIPMGWPDMRDQYTVGYYEEEGIAILALNENWADINECGSYNAAFVLKKEPGLYNGVGPWARRYFVWDSEKQGYFEQPEPEIFEHIAL